MTAPKHQTTKKNTSRSTPLLVQGDPEISLGLVRRLMRKTVPSNPLPEASPAPIVSPRPPGSAKKGEYWERRGVLASGGRGGVLLVFAWR